MVPSPLPKVAPPPKPAAPIEEGTQAQTSSSTSSEPESQTQISETFTVGVTDVAFNPVNAIFGRLLKTKDRHVVTLAYWEQKESVSHDEVPYFEQKL